MKNNLIICYGKNIKTKKELHTVVETFNHDVDIEYIAKTESKPEQIFSKTQHILIHSNYTNIYFLSNILDLSLLMYRLYHNNYNGFIYVVDKQNNSKNYKPYQAFLNSAIQEKEQILQPLYTLGNFTQKSPLNIETAPFIPFKNNDKTKHNNNTLIYHYKENFYIFDILSPTYEIVPLDNSNNPIHLKQLQFNKNFVQNHEMLLIINDVLTASKEVITEKFAALHNELKTIESAIQSNPSYQQNYTLLFNIILQNATVHAQIFIYSFLFALDKTNVSLFNTMLMLIKQSKALSFEEKYFLLYQCVRIGFTSEKSKNIKSNQLLRELYANIYDEFKKHLVPENLFIPKEQRNHNLIFFFTGQFLGLNHAPTKTALDRCYHLAKTLNKEVILINTKEVLTKHGFSPFYNSIGGNEVEAYNNINNIEYKDIKIPYYQPQQAMPNPQDILNIMQIVQEYKPYMILNIGSYNLTADLCSNLVPSVSIATVFSSIPTSMSQFLVTGKKPEQHQIEFLNHYGVQPESIIQSQFTFDLKPQTKKLTKSEIGVPEDKFLLAVIGARLDEEIDESFIHMVTPTFNENTHLVFIGKFDNYNNYCQQFKNFEENSTYLGFQDDVLAITQWCDLYLNPLRNGGGSSVLEAFVHGKPAITLKKGDVYVNTTDEFAVTDYNQMTQEIIKYTKDTIYYQEKSKKALQRADTLMNTAKQIECLMNSVENSPLFY